MNEMIVRAIKSKIITPKENLLEVLGSTLAKGSLKNGDILVITSKVVAVTQGRVAKNSNQAEFNALVKSESDEVVGGELVALTLKNGIFTPWAGIDKSNTKKGTVVLWPKNAYKAAQEVEQWLKKTFRLQKVGVIIVDSFCAPLRKGVIGIAVAHSGFVGVNDKRGSKDLYGNSLKFTQEAVADSLATAANFVMGQGKEQTPFAIITNAPVKFSIRKTSPNDLIMSEKDCLYAPFYRRKKSR